MYHSITFINDRLVRRNTWEDWGLIPTEMPLFAPPKTKTIYKEVPGSSDKLDLTESVKGYPLYQNRTGTISFILDNDYHSGTAAWSEIVLSSVREYLNGRVLKAVLEDDVSHYYQGRFFIDSFVAEPHWNKITIRYDLEPYKYNIFSSTEDWLWDPFNFETGVFQEMIFSDISVDALSDSQVIDISSIGMVGRMPICPIFNVTSLQSNITVTLENEELGINTYGIITATGRTRFEDFVLSNISTRNTLTLEFDGKGVLSIEFRSGGL